MTPPPFLGGQGRSSRSVRQDGDSLAFMILLCVGLLLACAAVGAWR